MAGAKAARVIRMVRLIRLAKLYKYYSLRQSPNVDHPDGTRKESHVGAEMSDRTTKRVIVGILIMLVGIPLFLVDKAHYFNATIGYRYLQMASNTGAQQSNGRTQNLC